MSDFTNNLIAENVSLKQQIEANKTGVNGLLAQLDATKHMFNEMSTSALHLRSSNIILQRNVQELNAKIENLNQQLCDATAKIASTPKE